MAMRALPYCRNSEERRGNTRPSSWRGTKPEGFGVANPSSVVLLILDCFFLVPRHRNDGVRLLSCCVAFARTL